MAANDNALAAWAGRRSGSAGAKAGKASRAADKWSKDIQASPMMRPGDAAHEAFREGTHLKAAASHKKAAEAQAAAGNHAEASRHVAEAQKHLAAAGEIRRDEKGRFAPK